MISSFDISINLNEDTNIAIESLEAKLPKLQQQSTVYLERLYNKLDSKGHNFSWMTQNQMDKVTSAALIVSAIAAASFSHVLLTALLGLGSCYYAKSFFTYDLDSMSVRSKVQENITRWSFNDLTARFAFEDILEYDLLKKVTDFYTTYQKVQIYADLKDLIDLEKKMRIDMHQKRAELKMRYPQRPDENPFGLHPCDLMIGAYQEKVKLLIEERYKKILEGAFLKEDLQ